MEQLITDQGHSNDNRLLVNAILFPATTGIRWRGLPERYPFNYRSLNEV